MVVIGAGNAFRQDDGVGLLVAQRLRELAPPEVVVLEHGGEGTGLMEAWQGFGRVILVDAVSSGSEPGVVYRFDTNEGPLPAAFSGTSTHAFGLAEAVELARALGQLPDQLIVYGIEGASFAPGQGLSPAVVQAAEVVMDRVLRELEM